MLQGGHVDEYRSHFDQYAAAGVDLRALPRVGVGSVCRRQGTAEGAGILRACADLGVRVHAFGVKVDGLRLIADRIASSDSMTWSFIARKRPIKLEGCEHVNCGNCFKWGMEWYRTRIAVKPSYCE